MDKLTVHFDNQPIYDIVFSESFDDLSQVLADFHLSSRRVCIVSESRVAGFYMEALKDVLRPLAREVVDFVFPEGGGQQKPEHGAKALRQAYIGPF